MGDSSLLAAALVISGRISDIMIVVALVISGRISDIMIALSNVDSADMLQ